ncbi:MAG: ABC transporter ATP-binding protein [Bacteroidota bacterium]
MPIVLEAQNLTKTYAGNSSPSLRNFALEVEEGQIAALLGESGSGKTTALRIIAGFENAEQGSVIINNKLMADRNTSTEPYERGTGIMFQDYALFPHKTVWKNITFGLHRLTKQKQQQAAENALQLTGLKGFENRYPHQLSGGQRQRVALARALAPAPQVLLMDEPFSNIDTMKKMQIREEIKSILKTAKATAVFVTHDTKDAMAIADTVTMLREGAVLQKGTPAEIYRHPVNEYTARFFGKVNVFQATITDRNTVNSEAGILKTVTDTSDFKHDKVKVTIRPNAFSVHTKPRPGAIPVKVQKHIFLGEYTELICKSSIPDKKPVEILVHINPELKISEIQLYLTVNQNDVWVMEA